MEIGDKVIYIEDRFAGEKGIIVGISESGYYLVKLDDGSRIKCLPQEIEKVEEPKPIPNTITITREEFLDAVKRVVTPSLYVDDINDYGMITAVCLSGELVCKKLARELFGDND